MITYANYVPSVLARINVQQNSGDIVLDTSGSNGAQNFEKKEREVKMNIWKERHLIQAWINVS